MGQKRQAIAERAGRRAIRRVRQGAARALGGGVGDQRARSAWTGHVSGSWHRRIQALCGTGRGGKKYSPHRRPVVATGAKACAQKKEVFPSCATRQARGLRKHEKWICDRHDFSSHANLFVQQLTKFQFPFATTEKLCLSHTNARSPLVGPNGEADGFPKKQGFRSDTN